MYKLLVIDDEPLVRKGILSLIPFEELGVDTLLEATNGEQGYQMVVDMEPDFVLCDINMPKLNGLDFARKVKETKPWIKIAIITGYDYFDYARQAVKIGVEDYILKPVSRKDVYEAVAGLISKREEEGKLKEVYKTIESQKNTSVDGDVTGYKEKIDGVIVEHLADEFFSLGLLSDSLGLSPTYLSALFKKLYGIGFSEYVLNLRLEKSKLLLLTTSLKNYEIAERVGISDPNYFSTLFKKKYGESPNKYKKKIKTNG